MSYSQNGEDLAIAACFHEDFTGTILELGAWEPKNLSNSRLLIERGWSAVLCEFSPVPVSKLVREYADNGRVEVIQAAITAEPGHVERFEITENALSSNDAEHLKLWAKAGGFYGSLWVPTLPLRALLDQFFGDRPIDVASIDTEGSSKALAIALMRTDHRPKVICVEHNAGQVEIMSVAQQFGYACILMNGENMVLRRGN